MGYFLDDSGNFENLVKIWPPTPPNYHQNASKNTRKIWNHPGQILFMSIWDIKNFEKILTLDPPTPPFVFCFSFYDNLLSIYLKNSFYGDEERKMINFPLINKRKAWIWILFVSKTWTGFYPKLGVFQEFTLNFCQGMYPKLFPRKVP